MKTIIEVKNDLESLVTQLKKFKDLQHNFTYADLDPEEVFLARKINGCLDMIEDLESKIKYLSAEIVAEGHLITNTNGRYEIAGRELTSGSKIEYWDRNYEEWSEDRIEHFNGKYGLYYKKKNDIDGLQARVRK